MKEVLLKAITIAYTCVGLISLIAYMPTLKDLAVHKKQSANPLSWALWTCTTGITFCYAWFVLKDAPFKFVSTIGFACCTTIFLLSSRLKKQV